MALLLLLTSPRVAPGLLTWAAWRALAEADAIHAACLDDPLPQAVRDTGHGVWLLGSDRADAGGDGAADPTPSRARALVEAATGADVVWLVGPDGDPGLTDAIAAQVTALESPPEVEVVVGSWDVPGARLLDVVAVMDRLRSPGGCPWDARQTYESLLPYLAEESEEYAEAVRSGDRAHMAEELGDVLLQVAFHARVAEDDLEAPFDIDDVAGLLVDKLVRRHPHVFGDVEASTPEEVEANWARIKEQERSGPGGAP